MRLHYADHFVLPLPEGHRFPMEKYARLRERLQKSAQFSATDFIVPDAATDTEILIAHSPGYLRKLVQGELSPAEQRRIGFPWSPAMVERSRRSAGATLAACRAALVDGCSANLAGGTHHAHTDFGSGFCVFNDAAIAARQLVSEDRLSHVAIIDCDVHQGDGTAAILADDPQLFTFSIHGEKNFPFRKMRSDLDIEMPDGTDDQAYLHALAMGLDTLDARIQPQLIIYLAGADPYQDDRFGRLGLSMAGLEQRDEMVLSRYLNRGIPVAMAMAGGYARNIDDTVTIHMNSIMTAKRLLG